MRSRRIRSVGLFLAAMLSIATILAGSGISAATTSKFSANLAVAPATLGSTGGAVKVKLVVHNARSCALTSAPALPNLDIVEPCQTITIVRVVHVKSNTTSAAKTYVIKATIASPSGKVTRMARLTVKSKSGSTASTKCPTGLKPVGPGVCGS